MIRFSSLFYRLMTGTFFVPILMFFTLFGGYYFFSFMAVIILVGTHEFYTMLGKERFDNFLIWGIVGSLAISFSSYYESGKYFSVIFTLFVMIIMLSKLITQDVEKATYHISTAIFGLIFVPWMASHLILLRELPNTIGTLHYYLGSQFVLLAFWLTWSCDTFAYFVGLAIGKHRLAPKVSPKKSVEGSIGGVLGSILGAVIAKYLLFRGLAQYIPFFHLIMLAIIASIAGQLGDLLESMLKRDYQIKDSAKIIPGHGGVMDRFDSLFFTAPLIYYYLKFIVFGNLINYTQLFGR